MTDFVTDVENVAQLILLAVMAWKLADLSDMVHGWIHDGECHKCERDEENIAPWD